jgi:YHS domain-containing protein
MNLIKVKCAFCGKEFFRPRGRVNEAKKFSWRQYCSRKCQNQAKVTRIEKVCGNPNCNKKVSRELAELKKSKSGRIFCSARCAAIFNNLPRRKIKTCPICARKFYGQRKYCSELCRSKLVSPNKKSKSQKEREILKEIKTFYKIHRRIPTKKERPGLAWRAQKVFGSWNKAIEAAGFESNPVIFSKKFIAKDGHRCDSFAEKIIDDWLTSRKIKHQKEIPYPENRLLSADFAVGNKFIEYFGLNGIIPYYDKLIKEKRKLSKKYKLSLIEIYPKDLFPVNHLSEIIKIKNIKKSQV